MKELKIKSLFGSEETKRETGCYAELLSLRYFRQAVKNYTAKRIDNDLFGPLVRNIADESCVYAYCKRLIRKKKDSDLLEEGLDNVDFELRRIGVRESLSRTWNNPKHRERIRTRIIDWTEAIIREYEEISAGDPLRGRLVELKKVLKLTDDEMSVLEVLWLLSTEKLEIADVPFAMDRVSGFVALATGRTEQEVRKTMMSTSRLCRFGCIQPNGHGRVHSKIRFFLDGVNNEPLASSFYRRDDEEALPAEFFGKLAEEHLPALKRLLAGSRGRKLNVLLYGAPGTGKTSFARALARATGRSAYQVCQRPKDRDGEFRDASPEIRYAAIEICDEQTDTDTSLMIVDEADVLLRGNRMSFFSFVGDAPTGDKGLLNDVLERIETPTVWIANTCAGEIDSSSRRRFDYAIRFDPLTDEQRLQTWKNAAQAAGADTRVPAEDLEKCCLDFPVSTGIAARAFENVVRADMKGAEAGAFFRQLLERQVELSGCLASKGHGLKTAANYSTEGLNIRTSIPLERIERAVERFLSAEVRADDADAPRMNLLLTGAPGCGKTEFCKHLAEKLHRPLLMRRASDLKSKWVGETEQNIAAAFHEARAKNAILFFDEVDSFLDDRSGMAQTHDKSMVNEVLQQMEAFGGVFIGTTNFKDSLDPAVARRFTFKVELDPPDAQGRLIFWKRFFGTEASPAVARRLEALDGVTPGDFRTVRQALFYLGEEATDDDRLNALQAELDGRVRSAHPIGFAG